ncbi:hypothetical protein VB773_19755 [Haloarculaceae archaeon H-GB2-1]|nr:hypothetical protein [Haloarculaceae archaeon H-GB1-1]MEA5409590.1 hypothetical protein [Haloarculaceae archaeon H-GB2-1]
MGELLAATYPDDPETSVMLETLLRTDNLSELIYPVASAVDIYLEDVLGAISRVAEDTDHPADAFQTVLTATSHPRDVLDALATGCKHTNSEQTYPELEASLQSRIARSDLSSAAKREAIRRKHLTQRIASGHTSRDSELQRIRNMLTDRR